MKLHEYNDAFEGAIIAAAEFFGIPQVYIEKDYWVTYALRQIFTDEKARHLAVFKGGTSLSKCYGIIDRFSEDIDIVVFQETNESGYALKKKLKTVTNSVGDALQYVPEHPMENKKGKIRKLIYDYQKAGVSGNFGQVRDQIAIEVSSLGNTDPYQELEIHSMITEFIAAKNNTDLINTYALEPFKVKVLAMERTFCEKIISLVRFSYDENPVQSLSNKIRHTYDLHQMLQSDKIQRFLSSNDFEIMLQQVGKDDLKAIPNDKQWLESHPSESLFFKKLPAIWSEGLKNTYSGSFKDLVTGEFPEEQKVLESLETIKSEILNIEWIN